MKKTTLLLTGLLTGISICGPARADREPIRPQNTWEFGTDRQRLSNGGPDWTEQTLRWNHWLDQHRSFDITVQQARRFGMQDEQLAASFTSPLTRQLSLSAEASLSPTHRFLAQHSTGLTLQYAFAPGWLAHGGIKSTHYDSGTVGQSTLALEHYVSSFSWSATWRPVRAFATDTSSSELRGNYYYGDRNFIGISRASGQEATPIGAGRLVLADIESLALTGRHWLTQNWAVSYALNSTRQGNFYNRDGIRFGVQYIF